MASLQPEHPHLDGAPLKRRPLPGTTVAASPISIGLPAVGADRPAGSPPSEAAIQTAISALTSGVGVVDTSNSYSQGRSEAAIGAAIQELGGVPEGTVVVTKCDRDLTTGRLDRDRVWRSFEESRDRLGIDYFPLYHLHDPYTITFAEAAAPGGALEGLAELHEQGLVGALGIAAAPLDLLDDYVDTGLFRAILTHNRFTLVDRTARGRIDAWTERGLGVLNGAPFGGGLLAAGPSRVTTYEYQPAPAELLEWTQSVEQICQLADVPLAALALQFSLRNEAIVTTLVGTTKPDRVAQTLRLAEVSIPDSVWAAVDALPPPPR